MDPLEQNSPITSQVFWRFDTKIDKLWSTRRETIRRLISAIVAIEGSSFELSCTPEGDVDETTYHAKIGSIVTKVEQARQRLNRESSTASPPAKKYKQ